MWTTSYLCMSVLVQMPCFVVCHCDSFLKGRPATAYLACQVLPFHCHGVFGVARRPLGGGHIFRQAGYVSDITKVVRAKRVTSV